jgi:glycerol-3-phosphate acyltransferase PlsX
MRGFQRAPRIHKPLSGKSLTNARADIRIAVDAMGGDFAPASVVQGSLEAVRHRPEGLHVILVGPEDLIRGELEKLTGGGKFSWNDGLISLLHAPDIIDMHDSPTAALKAKKKSSIAVGLRQVHEGNAAAFVSAGNTGAVLSASTLILGRLPNVSRPTIGALIPTAKNPCLLVDAGANVDCKPRHLYEFGVMGSIYAGTMLGIPNPSIGLLNIGEEDSKGNTAAQEAYRLFSGGQLRFVGNIEGRDVLSGNCDVIVCDGFVGNILMKFGESVPGFLKSRFTQLAKKSVAHLLVALLARNSLRSVMKDLDYQEHGGVPVLGVQGVSIIGHGRSTPKAIMNMIFRAEDMAIRKVHQQIEESLSRVHPSQDQEPR